MNMPMTSAATSAPRFLEPERCCVSHAELGEGTTGDDGEWRGLIDVIPDVIEVADEYKRVAGLWLRRLILRYLQGS